MNRTMQPRLRGTVTYLRTGAGMIFRNGDSFLPINGNGVWDSYQAIKPLVESAQPDKELFSELETILHGPMAKLITALESAGMLYDATNDGGGNLPPEALAYFDRERARLETKSDFPLKTFAQLRAKRVLIAGTSEMVTATAEAALGTGLCHLILLASCWSEQDELRLREMVRSHGSEKDGPKVEAHAWDSSWHNKLNQLQWDELLAVRDIERDDSPLHSAVYSLLRGSRRCGMTLNAGGRRVVTCACEADAGCPACIEEMLAVDPGFAEPGDAFESKGLIAIGAHMLLRHFWDVRLEGSNSIARHTIMELEKRTHRISRKPRPLCATCRLRRVDRTFVFKPDKPETESNILFPKRVDFCKNAETLFVDRETGIIRELEEGDLLQYPYHQCAARVEESDGDTDSPWVQECGEEMIEARAGTISRALERIYDQRFRNPHANGSGAAICNAIYNSSGLQIASTKPAYFDLGLTVSGGSWRELVEQSLFRTLAKHAHAQKVWTRVDTPQSLASDPEVSLLSEYLKDIGAFDSVLVYEQCSGLDDCSVFRFHYRGQPVSVVAGTDRVLSWKTGLQDIWMHLSANDSRPDDERSNPPAIRFRAAYGEKCPLDIAQIERRLGVRLCIVPIPSDDAMKLLSLSFAYAYFDLAAANDSTDDNGEEATSATYFEQRRSH